MTEKPTLVSHRLCPYVQRAAIALAEKGVSYDRVYVDLADKPAWFERLSPLGKVPLLKTDRGVIFESAVILEYLEETAPEPLHPSDPFERARHRGWIEFASATLNDIASFYTAADAPAFRMRAEALARRFERVEAELQEGPWFGGARFSLVDAAFAPVFRYFDTFDAIEDFGVSRGRHRVAAWRDRLARRQSVRTAVEPTYPTLLLEFLRHRRSYIAKLAADAIAA